MYQLSTGESLASCEVRKQMINPNSNKSFKKLFVGTLTLGMLALAAYAASPVPVSGTVTLEDFVGSTAGRAVTVSIQKENSATVDNINTTLDENGQFTVMTEIRGSVDVWIKADGFIDDDAKEKHLKVTDAGLAGLTFNLDGAGDIDDDDDVNIFDYSCMSDHWDESDDDAHWDDKGSDGVSGHDCDLDGDGRVSVFDFTKLSYNWERRGRHRNG